MTPDTRSRDANVVATFDSQFDADEAILELRLAGFRDSQIGYFTHSPNGELTDLLERNYWIAGAGLGAIAGAALGVWLARAIPGWQREYLSGIDTLGMLITCLTFGMLFLGTIGGLIGEAILRRTAITAPDIGRTDGPLIVAVRSGEEHDKAAELLRRRGGHVMVAGTGPATAGPHPAVHPV
jgi:hypothetical protein